MLPINLPNMGKQLWINGRRSTNPCRNRTTHLFWAVGFSTHLPELLCFLFDLFVSICSVRCLVFLPFYFSIRSLKIIVQWMQWISVGFRSVLRPIFGWIRIRFPIWFSPSLQGRNKSAPGLPGGRGREKKTQIEHGLEKNGFWIGKLIRRTLPDKNWIGPIKKSRPKKAEILPL